MEIICDKQGNDIMHDMFLCLQLIVIRQLMPWNSPFQ